MSEVEDLQGLTRVLPEMARPDLYRQNAFRLTGLATNASYGRVKTCLEELRALARLGQLPDASLDEETIRGAAQRLKDPERRLLEEIFWIWPESTDHQEIVTEHNLAVHAHSEALELELLEEQLEPEQQSLLDGTWDASIRRWSTLIDNHRFWDFIAWRMRELDDPRVRVEEIPGLRRALPEALASINAQLAMRAFEIRGHQQCRRHVELVRRLAPQAAGDLLRGALEPARDKIRAICESVKPKPAEDPGGALQAARALLVRTGPSLAAYAALLPASDVIGEALHDDVAEIALDCVLAYSHATADWAPVETVLERILPLAASAQLRQRIEGNLATARQNRLYREFAEPVTEELASIRALEATPWEKLKRLQGTALPLFDRLRAEAANDGSGAEILSGVAREMEGALGELSITLRDHHQDYAAALEALCLAQALCMDPEAREALRQNATILEEREHERRLCLGLAPVREPPWVGATLGTGVALYGQSDYDSRTGSCLANRYLTVLFLPLVRLGRYRVRRLPGGGYQFLGREDR